MIDGRKIDIIKNGKPVKILDIVAIAVLTIVAITLIVSLLRKPGAYLCVRYDGQETYYSLSENIQFSVGGHVTVKIENGYAYVIDADCGNRDCIDLGGKIKYVGQKIVCAPNKIVLKVVSERKDDPEWIIT